MKLSLGFEAVPYTGKRSPLVSHFGRVRRGTGQYGYGKTTAQVAVELEERYRIVETFYQLEEDNIIELIENAFAEDLDDVQTMVKLTKRVKGFSTSDTDKIERKFRDNINNRRYDGVIPGVPTTAALRGVSHLLPQPYSRKNSTRPSFKDTSLYMNSFRAWVEEGD